MNIRLGYACITKTLDITSSHTITYTNYEKLSKEEQYKKLTEITTLNLNNLEQILIYNIKNIINPDKYKEMLYKHSNVVLISSGHYYQESILQDDKGIRHISVPAFIDMPYSYQLVKIIYDSNKHKSAKDVEVVVERVKI